MILKYTRIIIAALVFLGFSVVLFLNFEWTKPLAAWLTATQMVASYLEFMRGNRLAVGFLLILVATWLFGRLYCSCLCPLGILQDVVIWGRHRLAKSKKWRRVLPKSPQFVTSYGWLKYSLLCLFLACLVTGSTIIVTVLDPYSIFGRTMYDIVRPVVATGYNLVVTLLEHSRIYSFPKMAIGSIGLFNALSAWLMLATIVVLAWRSDRGYCNNICPVGSLLGLVSRFSLFKIRLQPKCRQCKVCQSHCKGRCLDISAGRVDHANCVACFNCLGDCRQSAVVYGMAGRSLPVEPHARQQDNTQTDDLSRRQFLLNSGAVLTGATGSLLTLDAIKQRDLNTLRRQPSLIIPPGAVNLERFTRTCTACHLCIVHCPSKVLKPAGLEYHFSGIWQPRLEYTKSFCEYECNACSQVCPTGAIQKAPLEAKKLVQIGTVQLIENLCMVFAKKKDCSACAEHCPTQAIYTLPYETKLFAPHVKTEFCIGCGACEFACPVAPKAVVVKGHLTHQQAQKNTAKKIKFVKPPADDPFPF